MNLKVNREHPIFFIFSDLVSIQPHHTLSRENSAEEVRALLVLKVAVPGHVDIGGGELHAPVKRVGPNDVVVDLEPLVGVVRGDVENEVVVESAVVGGVIKLCEVRVNQGEPR